MASTTKTRRQVRFLLSRGSPLSRAQKEKLRRELHAGTVRVVRARRKRR